MVNTAPLVGYNNEKRVRTVEVTGRLIYYGANLEGSWSETLSRLWEWTKGKPLASRAVLLAVNPAAVDEALLAAALPAELTTSILLPKHIGAVILGELVETYETTGKTAIVRCEDEANDRGSERPSGRLA